MTSLPPRRLVASGRFPLGRIWREVPSVTDRSAILGPGGGGRLSLSTRVSAALLLPHPWGWGLKLATCPGAPWEAKLP